MSKNRIIVLGLAVAAGAGAIYMSKNILGKKTAATEVVEINKVETSDVLIASKDILMGDKLSGGSIGWQPWPKANITDPMVTRDEKPDALTEWSEARARLAIYNGEPVIEKKVVIPGQGGFLSAVLPKGMKAISVAISEHTSAGGFILPNDRVDIILTKKVQGAETSGQSPAVTETLITNVRVLAINQTYRQEEGENKVTVTEGKTATLELDARGSEVISLAESLGELSLSLRSIADSEGAGMDKPKVAEKYTKPGAKGTDLLSVRYGIETYSANK
jgi:pilus assembly protein CpaB